MKLRNYFPGNEPIFLPSKYLVIVFSILLVISIGLTTTIVYGQETYTTDEIEELSQQGLYFYNSGNYKQALEIFEELFVLHTKLGDEVGVATDHNNIGNVLKEMGHLDAALESHQKSLGIRTKLGDEVGVATNHQNIGNVLRLMDHLDAALESYQKALGTYTKLGDEVGIAAVKIAIEKINQPDLSDISNGSEKISIPIENTSPELTMSDGPIKLKATTPEGAEYNFVATAYDKEDGELKPNCTHEPGLFPIGTTPVECSVTDKDGNKKEGRFTVIVEEYDKSNNDFGNWTAIMITIIAAVSAVIIAWYLKNRKPEMRIEPDPDYD